MKIVRLSIDRPVTISVFFLAVVLLGLVSLRQLSVDLLPDISYPRLSVVTSYAGVAPEEIETLVTAPLEASVSRIPGLRRVESVSKEGVSFMTLEFGWGTDMDFALLHLREKLDSALNLLPEDAEDPVIIPLDPQSKPIMVLALTGERSLLDLKEFTEELVKPRLEQVEGIGSAEITGGVEREIQVELNPRLLALYGLSVEDVARRVAAFNRNLQGGTIHKGRFKYAFRVVGEYASVGEIEEVSLKTTPERGVVRLKDVAVIRDSIKEREGMSRLNGKESIGVLVRKESGANTVKATALAKKAIAQMRRENPGVQIHVISEQARYIEEAVATAADEIISGALLAFLVLLLFLQEWKTPLIIGTVIPISVIGTFNLLFFNNITLNIMSLGGLALGVGMLDDCAVIVSESIFRHRALGKSLKEAAYAGTREVGMAVIATALTTVVVFLPVIYIHGVAGQLFKDVALTVTFALLASLLVSLTLLPMLSSRKFKLETNAEETKKEPEKTMRFFNRPKSKLLYLLLPLQAVRWLLYRSLKVLASAAGFVLSFILQLITLFVHYLSLPFRPILRLVFSGFNFIYGRFVLGYERFLGWSLKNKGKVLAASLLFFLLALCLGFLLPRELMPKMDTSSFELSLETPADYSLEQTSEIVSFLEQRLMEEKKYVRRIFSQVGIISGLESLNPDVSLNYGRVYVELDKPTRVETVLESMRERLSAFPDIKYSFLREQATLGEYLGFTAAEVKLKVKGDSLEELKKISENLVFSLRDVKGIADLKTGVAQGKPEFLVQINKNTLAKYPGISPADLGQYIVNAVRGRVATQLKVLGKKYDIRVRLEQTTREDINALLNSEYPHQGRLIPLRELLTYETIGGPDEIRRENQQREIQVTASLKGAKISQVAAALEKKIKDLARPEGYRVVFAGEREELGKSFRSLLVAFLLAVALNYMIMAAQFESLRHPLLILFTLPMGVSGVILALFLTGQTVNVMSVIGVVVLVGIVVDNAIVKVDYTNQLRKQGLALREAVLEASHIRLRPILMTTLSTIFGLVPMAVGLGKGAELLRPLAIAVIGGLTLSTFLTLVLIPVVYEAVEKRRS